MDNSLKITALPREKLIALLRQAGSREISAEKLDTDIESGAPINDDGTFNLITYAAWLVRSDEDGN